MDKKKSIILRIDTSLSDELNIWAKDELRSLNAQIEYILRDAVRKRKKSGGDATSNQSNSKKSNEAN